MLKNQLFHAVCIILFLFPAFSIGDDTIHVSVSWNNIRGGLSTYPSLQVVSHHLLLPSSPIYNKAFSLLQGLKAHYVRYVPWLPLPKLGVGELDPPSGTRLCSGAVRGQQYTPTVINCGILGGKISDVVFASYGTPTGICGAFQINAKCHAENSSAVIQKLCIGQSNCVINVTSLFGDPCVGTTKTLALEVTCSNSSKRHTYWNMTLPDQMMLDVWNALDGNNTQMVPDFSTAPTWLYDNKSWTYCDDPRHPCGGYETGRAPAINSTALGDYYGRLLSWYTRGGFIDEYGELKVSGHALNITIWEIFNEVDHEHGYTKESYVKDFDAIVKGIRRWADPEHKIKFIGLNLPNIDKETVILDWASYFLNTANHSPDVRDNNALAYIGFHAYPTNGGYTKDPKTFSRMFDYADTFYTTVNAVDALLDKLSPTTQFHLNECGTDMDNVLPNRNDPSSAPAYWVASGAYFAYLWARLSDIQRIVVVGQSQFMDDGAREPSVSMVNWLTGEGTARYWVLKMLIEKFHPGSDNLVQTTADSSKLFAQGFIVLGDGKDPNKRLLLINKQYSPATVNVMNVTWTDCTLSVIDEKTGEGPPRVEPCPSPLVLAPYATAILDFS